MAARQNFIVQVANVSKDAPLDVEKWICIYPAYIDQQRTLKEGRRLSKEKLYKKPRCIRNILCLCCIVEAASCAGV